MGDTLYNHYQTEYTTNWLSRVQQKKSKLRQIIENSPFQGEKKRYDRMGGSTVQERTMRNGPTPIGSSTSDSRWAKWKSFDIPAHLVDRDEAQNLGSLMLPNSEYIRQDTFAYNRKFDEYVLRTAVGAVWTGADGDTSTAFAGGSVTAGSGLTIGKILEVREYFGINEASEMEEGESMPIWVHGPRDLTDLLGLTEVKSADYNTIKALANGQVDTFCGFRFVQSNRVYATGGTYQNVVFYPSALRITEGPLSTKISELANQSYSTQIYSYFTLAGTRVHDEGVCLVTTTT